MTSTIQKGYRINQTDVENLNKVIILVDDFCKNTDYFYVGITTFAADLNHFISSKRILPKSKKEELHLIDGSLLTVNYSLTSIDIKVLYQYQKYFIDFLSYGFRNADEENKFATIYEYYMVALTQMADSQDFRNYLKNKSEKEEEEKVNNPSHYSWFKDKYGIELTDILLDFDFVTGNVLKYVFRSGKKREEGYTEMEKELEDLKKAEYYLSKKINDLENKLKLNKNGK